MHPEIRSASPGTCPICGMKLVPVAMTEGGMDHHEHTMKPGSEMSRWDRFKMSMTMTMGMEHSGVAGREMARLMELDIRNKFFFALVLSVPIILYSPLGKFIFGIQLPAPFPVPWLLFLLTTPVYFYSGWIFLYSSFRALQQRTLNMSVLIATGITAAYSFSVLLTILQSADSYYEATALLITFVLFGHWLEMRSRRGTTDALEALLQLVPPQARVLREGKEILVPTSQVGVGDMIVLKPGDRVPVDGRIVEGETAIDESLVTGESLPVAKTVGIIVIGGSINQSGSVKFEATKVGEETALAQIVRLVEAAQNSKAPGQRLADRFAQYLVVLAIGAGLVTFLVWFGVARQPVLTALTFAISAIVIACPDALGLATPTAVAVGTGLGARHNILIKDAPTLEGVSKIQAVVFDKTGTLTEGKPRISEIATIQDWDEDGALRLVAGAEAESNHPLSNAVLEEVKKRQLQLPARTEHFENMSGLGVKASIEGKEVMVGTVKLMKQSGIDTAPLQDKIDQLVGKGETIMVLAADGRAIAAIGAADTVKPSAKVAVSRLNQLGIETAMITGDNQATAEAVARIVGIKRVFADVLPRDKALFVKKLQDEGKVVAMVGDGVNDAPALAQADIGIAIGAGTDVAIETAKVVLMKSDPSDVLRAIRLSKATVTKMKQNLFWASFYNILAIPVAAGILYPNFGIILRPEVSALLMSASSIIVATNAVLLKRAEKSLVAI
ncbi:MAG: copper-translocating P-type ATPase [Crenarchaeota archaeon 13_1_20CM_2_51_8]|nr:MAG: copper-translocating P-type ATPase [Crenarchaeota archaeon 13_1_20CM_2_51_8]